MLALAARSFYFRYSTCSSSRTCLRLTCRTQPLRQDFNSDWPAVSHFVNQLPQSSFIRPSKKRPSPSFLYLLSPRQLISLGLPRPFSSLFEGRHNRGDPRLKDYLNQERRRSTLTSNHAFETVTVVVIRPYFPKAGHSSPHHQLS